MRPEQQIQQASRPTRHANMTRRAPIRLDDVAAPRMAVQRPWNDAEGEPAFSPDVQSSLRILSVYAGHKIAACESDPSVEALGGLNVLARNLPGSLGEWREAA